MSRSRGSRSGSNDRGAVTVEYAELLVAYHTRCDSEPGAPAPGHQVAKAAPLKK